MIVSSAFPAAVAAFVVFYWLESALWISLGIFVFGMFKTSVPALIIALAQQIASPGQRRHPPAASSCRCITPRASSRPLIAAKLITASADIVLAMILTTAVPLIVYGSLIGAMRVRASAA